LQLPQFVFSQASVSQIEEKIPAEVTDRQVDAVLHNQVAAHEKSKPAIGLSLRGRPRIGGLTDFATKPPTH
jgi:hypothetical protein